MKEESLHVTGRLLGYRRATTDRHAHLDDAKLSQVAAHVAVEIQKKPCFLD